MNEERTYLIQALEERAEKAEAALAEAKKATEYAKALYETERSENERLLDERQRDALDGQAALDEANNEVVRLREALEKVEELTKHYHRKTEPNAARVHEIARNALAWGGET